MSTPRSKPGISSHDFKYRPSLFRQRQSSNEFGTASKAGGLFRQCIASLLSAAKDTTTHSRFASRMLDVLKTDTINPAGERRVENGNIKLLQGFEFNSHSSLHNILVAQYKAGINRETGELTLSFRSFIPNQNIKAAPGTSHFKIVMAGLEADFASDSIREQIVESAFIPMGDLPTGDQQFTSKLTANSTLPLFMVAGIQFYDLSNGVFYPLKDKKFNPLAILKVNT